LPKSVLTVSSQVIAFLKTCVGVEKLASGNKVKKAGAEHTIRKSGVTSSVADPDPDP